MRLLSRYTQAASRARALLAAMVLGVSATLLQAVPAYALDAGTYLVGVSPSYKDPVSGAVEDPGNNEAIGQGMTERLCGNVGLLEVDASGETYLTVRYYLSQFIGDVTFEERVSGGSFKGLSYTEMQTKEPVEGSTDLEEKYGYTDYRMKITDMGSTFRGKAYVEPMGRNVVYFFTVSGPRKGTGDFITAQNAGGKQTTGAQPSQAAVSPAVPSSAGGGSQTGGGAAAGNSASQAAVLPGETLGSVENGINGSGNVNDAVTGIPQKPAAVQESQPDVIEEIAGSVSGQEGAGEDLSLQTGYDLAAVPTEEARELTAPILEEATGITAMAGGEELLEEEAQSQKEDGEENMNKSIMLVLVGLAGGLLICFLFSGLNRRGKGEGDSRLASRRAKQREGQENKEKDE